MQKYVRLAISIAICQMAGVIGAVFTTPNIATWYAMLNKPAFTPPDWVFGPVWLTLYTLMGISLWLVWSKGIDKETKHALYPFGAQLALNTIWSVLFFGLRSPLLGLATIIPLWLLIAYTMFKFYKLDKNAAYLLVPYILWSTVATYLNLGILLLN